MEVAGGLTKSRSPPVIGRGCIFGVLWLVLRWKWEQNLEQLSLRPDRLTLVALEGFVWLSVLVPNITIRLPQV